MAETKETIISDIKNYIARCGGSYTEWYVGITSDPRKRLFVEHMVDEKNDYWTHKEAFSSESARIVEDYFVNTLKTKGDAGGGDDASKYVYAYKINNHTIE